MMPVPHMGLTEPLRFDPPPARHYCECGITFEAPSEEEAVRLHAEHQAEMLRPEEHEGVCF